MTDARITFGRHGVGPQLADLVRDARRLVGWTQRELADRSGTSQATIWRIESARSRNLDLALVDRVLTALGMRGALDVDGRHLADRRRQGDGLHARLNGYLARRLVRAGWLTATEVRIGAPPRGWIDLLAYRSADGSLLVDETKTQVDDLGGIQRSIAFYEREGPSAARRLGWEPRRCRVMAVVLDTDAVARRLRDARDLVSVAFPAPVADLAAWIADPRCPPPAGWSIAAADPASRGSTWLRPVMLGSRRRLPPYADYGDAAARLLRG